MQSLRENKMGTRPIGSLLFTMALPLALSMLVQAIYNVVDSAFVSNLSNTNQDALIAVSLVFPVQNIMIGVATGIAVGVNAILSRALGEKDQKTVNASACNGLFLTVIAMIVAMTFGIFGAEPFMRSLTHNEVVIDYGTDYIRIVTIASFGIFGEIFFERLLQSTGKTVHTFITQGTGAVVNIILDPILIFGMFGFPRMEVIGAAVATVIGQVIAFILALILNHKCNEEVHLKLRSFRPDGKMLGKILGIGVPSVIMVAIGSVMYFYFNKILMSFEAVTEGLGEIAAAVFAAYFKLQSFVFMPVFGINNAVLAITAFNYGARQPKRIMKTIRCGAVSCAVLMLIGILIFQLFPAWLLSLFNANEEMTALGIPALRILCLPFLLAGPCIVFGGVFQALGKSIYSLFTSIARQILVLLPAAYLLSRTGVVENVWYSFPIAELASLAASIVLILTVYRKKIKPLYNDQPSPLT